MKLNKTSIPNSTWSDCHILEYFDVLDHGVAVYSAIESGEDFIFVYFNPAAEKMEQISASRLLGRRVTEVFPGVEKCGLLSAFRRVLNTGKSELLPATKYQDGRIQGWRENHVYRLPNGYIAAVYEDVTDREELRLKSEANHLRYRLLAESTLDGVWEWDIVAGTLYLSPKWKAQLGFEDHELPNAYDTWIGRLHPDDKARVAKHIDAYLKAPADHWSAEFRLQHKNGHYKWTLARGMPVIDENGVPLRLLGVHIDIDEQKSIGNRLKDNEQRLSLALSSANQGLYDINIQTGEASVNPQYAIMLGYKPESFVESVSSCLERIHPDDQQRVLNNFNNYLSGAIDEYRSEFRLRTKSGEWLWILSLGRLVEKDAEGNPLRLLGTHTDITELKTAQEKVRQAAQVFSSTIEGVTITDTEGAILDVNKAFCDITGYSREEVLGQNPRILKSNKHDQAFYQAMWQSLHEQGYWRGEIWNQKKDGEIFPELLTISSVVDSFNNVTGYVAVFTDITQTKESEKRLDYLAHHDPLTGLPNRILFNAILEQAIHRSTRERETIAVLFIDLDRFKHINDSYGHAAGDELLTQCAVRLTNVIRGEDRVARLSGDEFVGFLENVGSSDNASLVVRKIMSCFKEPFILNNNEVSVTCSVGISLFPDDSATMSELVSYADTAMYLAKEEGRNTYQFYTSEMTTAAAEFVFMENAIRRALKENHFYLVYQPQLDLKNNTLCGLEALIRWQHPEQGVIAPGHFIPIAEKIGLVREIGKWVLNEACRQASEWQQRGLQFGYVSVNVSGRQIKQADFAAQVKAVLIQYQLAPNCLELEVTESYLMDHQDEGVRQLRELRDLGVSIAIDDFGKGYSSLNYLKLLPVDKLKIDQSFVRDIPEDVNDMAISEAVIALGKALDLSVIGEGIETEDQISFLKDKGCQFGQGYYFSKPKLAADIDGLLAQEISDN